MDLFLLEMDRLKAHLPLYFVPNDFIVWKLAKHVSYLLGGVKRFDANVVGGHSGGVEGVLSNGTDARMGHVDHDVVADDDDNDGEADAYQKEWRIRNPPEKNIAIGRLCEMCFMNSYDCAHSRWYEWPETVSQDLRGGAR